MYQAIDISVPVFNGMLHPGVQPSYIHVEKITNGDAANVTRWTIGAHTGTHVEAPLHTQRGGSAIDELPLELFVGPARVLDLTSVESEIRPEDLIAAGLGDDERLLLHTSNSEHVLHNPEKPSSWVGIAPEAARLLVERGVRLLGFDFYTVETHGRDKTFDSHYILSEAGIVTIEQIDLAAAPAGLYELVCLPVMLRGSEAGLARAVLLPPSDGPDRALTDLTVPVHGEMLHWGRTPTSEVVESFDNGNACNVSRWTIGSHTGFHIDSGMHFDDDQPPIDQMPLETFIGEARVLDLTSVEDEITAADLLAAGLGDEQRVLLKTSNSADALKRPDNPEHDWIGLAPDGAQLLIDRGVKLVSIDFLTIDTPSRDETWDTHRLLMPAGIAIVECADLDGVEAGVYELVALPLKLQGSEAAPAGGFIRPLQ